MRTVQLAVLLNKRTIGSGVVVDQLFREDNSVLLESPCCACHSPVPGLFHWHGAEPCCIKDYIIGAVNGYPV